MDNKQMKTYQLILHMIKYKPGLYLTNCALWMIIYLIPLVLGYITKEYLDLLTGVSSYAISIQIVIITMVVLLALRILIIRIAVRVDTFQRYTITSLIRYNLFERVLFRISHNKGSQSTGIIVNTFRDDAGQIDDSVNWTIDIVSNVFFAVVAVVILWNINKDITLYVFTPLVLIVAVSQFASKLIEKYRKMARESTGNFTGALGEAFDNIQAIKVNGAERNIIDHIGKLNSVRQRNMVKDALLNTYLNVINTSTVSIGIVVILIIAAKSIIDGSLSIGELTLFLSYLTYVTECSQFLGTFMAHYKQTGVAFRRMADIVEVSDDKELLRYTQLDAPVDSPTQEQIWDRLKILEIKNLCYRYKDSNKGIFNIDFIIKKGQVIVITGQIGSGKTTLLRTVLGLIPKDSGEIYWNGSLISDISACFVPPRCGYTSQVPNLFSDSVKQNVLLGISEQDADIENAINNAILDIDIINMDNGLETTIGSRGVKLSGGQKQRVAIARMLVRKPDLIVIDDMSSALDVETERKLWNKLFDDKESAKIIVSNKKFAFQRADTIIVMDNGKIIANDKLSNLLNECEEFKKMWGNGEDQVS